MKIVYLLFLIKIIEGQNIYNLTNMHILTRRLQQTSPNSIIFELPEKDTSKNTTNSEIDTVFEEYKEKLKTLFFQELKQRSKATNPNINTIPLNYKKPGIKISRPISLLILQLLNSYRTKNNLQKIKWNENVYRLTLNHSYYMEENKEISHDNLKNRINNKYLFANENVAMFGGALLKEDEIARRFFDMWRKSEGHDENMKEERVREGAIGMVVNYDSKEYYSTMILVE